MSTGEKVQITFVEGPTTPDRYRDRIGTKSYPFDPADRHNFLPAPGSKGQLMGIPGIMREGLQWEIADVDLRSETEKILDEAQSLLAKAPTAGEPIAVVLARQAKAQHLLLNAQLRILSGWR